MKLVAPWRKKQGKPGRIGIGMGSDYVSLVYMDQPNQVALCQYVVSDGAGLDKVLKDNACATPSWSLPWDFDAHSGADVGLANCQVSVTCSELTPDSGGTFYDIEAEGQCAYGAETDDSAVRIVRMQAKL